jgi:hypothetical protein
MQLAEARIVACDKRPCIHQRLFPESALSPALVLLLLAHVALLHALALLPLVAVALPHASAPAVPLQALGARLRSHLRSDPPLCWGENARNSGPVETQVTAVRGAGDLI